MAEKKSSEDIKNEGGDGRAQSRDSILRGREKLGKDAGITS